jgi:hypothetical protein
MRACATILSAPEHKAPNVSSWPILLQKSGLWGFRTGVLRFVAGGGSGDSITKRPSRYAALKRHTRLEGPAEGERQAWQAA